MAIMWLSKDGKRPNTQRGPGINLSPEEINAIFGKAHLRYVGTEAPSTNPETPSHSEKNVVLEIGKSEGLSELLPKYGFYLVVGVRPRDAEIWLLDHRSAA